IIVSNSLEYIRAFSLVLGGPPKLLRFLLVCLFSSFALIGYLKRLTTAPQVSEFYVPIYLAVTVLWPFPGGLRYLVPILPLYVIYGLLGFHQMIAVWFPRRQSHALAALVLLIASSYAMSYAKTDFGPFPAGIGKQSAIELFQYVRTGTDASAVLIFRK